MEHKRIGRYALGPRIGQGGLATVYRARDTKLDREVALKLLATEVADPDIRRRFQLEAKATANLEHRSIVRTFDYSDDDSDALFMVMEYIHGPNLHQWVERHGPMSEQFALCIGAELTDALVYAHDRNIVHRDIKPSNVMLDGGRVVLVDFGGIKLTDTLSLLPVSKRDETRPIGTPGFMAPEQFEGRAVSPQTDIFAVGALLYFLTTGQLPYHGPSEHESYAQVRKGRFRDPRDHQPLLTPAFCYLLGDCLAVKPDHRLTSAAELRSQIGRLLTAHGVEDVTQTLRLYSEDPTGAKLAVEEQSVAALMRDLKLALFRELQSARSEQRADVTQRVVVQLQQLAEMEHPAAMEEQSRAAEVLQAGRAPRRSAWWALGGFGAGAGAVAAAVWWLMGAPPLSELVRDRVASEPAAAATSANTGVPAAVADRAHVSSGTLSSAAVDMPPLAPPPPLDEAGAPQESDEVACEGDAPCEEPQTELAAP